ncbi:MAG TPA: phytoene dehydrogenase [Opitutae bacterium]|nr:phytoene dehydrogenase [Opitutae bacterium]
MARDTLADLRDYYDVVVIGSGLGGLTGANCLAKQGHSVLLLEHHYQFGGLATWFKRAGGHIFDISLHGFPVGMIKSCKRYWTKEIADSIVQLKNIRFINPQYDLKTTFDRSDFTKILQTSFNIAKNKVEEFYDHMANMDYFANDKRSIGDLLEEFFPGRNEIKRLLLEPISYANGSSLVDPAIAYGIVFSNFMKKGIYTFKDGTDSLIKKMVKELRNNGADLRRQCLVEEVITNKVDKKHTVEGVVVNGKKIRCGAVLSNANLKNTIEKLFGLSKLPKDFADQAKSVRLNSTSCQVYIGLKRGVSIPDVGDLIFTSESPSFSTDELTDFHTTSRTFSVYYPDTRPDRKEPRYSIVASINAKWQDWQKLPDEEYAQAKNRLCEESVVALEKIIPDIRDKIDHLEAATPRTIQHYTHHASGASFGTKFEGLDVSSQLPDHAPGLYHAGSVGIIMSGWLGTINYGVITANKIDRFLRGK